MLPERSAPTTESYCAQEKSVQRASQILKASRVSWRIRGRIYLN